MSLVQKGLAAGSKAPNATACTATAKPVEATVKLEEGSPEKVNLAAILWQVVDNKGSV